MRGSHDNGSDNHGAPPGRPGHRWVPGGIGRAVAEKLAADGSAVVLVFSGGPAAGRGSAGRHHRRRRQALAVQADIADETEMAVAFDRVEQEFGGVDVVVNTAGIMLLAPVAELDLADLDRMYRTNIRRLLHLVPAGRRQLRPAGALISFSTSVTRLQQPGYAAYAASKGAVEAMTLILAASLNRAGHYRQHRRAWTDRHTAVPGSRRS